MCIYPFILKNILFPLLNSKTCETIALTQNVYRKYSNRSCYELSPYIAKEIFICYAPDKAAEDSIYNILIMT